MVYTDKADAVKTRKDWLSQKKLCKAGDTMSLDCVSPGGKATAVSHFPMSLSVGVQVTLPNVPKSRSAGDRPTGLFFLVVNLKPLTETLEMGRTWDLKEQERALRSRSILMTPSVDPSALHLPTFGFPTL